MNKNKEKDMHLFSRGENWAVIKEGNSKATKVFDNLTKKEATKEARKIIGDSPGSLTIHNKDGKIREERTYNKKDPYPPKG